MSYREIPPVNLVKKLRFFPFFPGTWVFLARLCPPAGGRGDMPAQRILSARSARFLRFLTIFKAILHYFVTACAKNFIETFRILPQKTQH